MKFKNIFQGMRLFVILLVICLISNRIIMASNTGKQYDAKVVKVAKNTITTQPTTENITKQKSSSSVNIQIAKNSKEVKKEVKKEEMSQRAKESIKKQTEILKQGKMINLELFVSNLKNYDLSEPEVKEILKDAVEPLIKILENNRGIGNRSDAASCLGEISDKRAIPILKKMSKQGETSETWIVRKSSMDGLAKIMGKEAIPYIKENLNHKDIKTQLVAVGILAELGEDKSLLFSILEKTIKDKYPTIRWRTIFSLEKIGDEKAIKLIETLLNDPDERVREQAERVLKRLKGETSIK